MLQPAAPPYDVREWQKKPFFERLRMVCQAWALQGYGTPPLIYTAYILKVVVYVLVWCFLVSFTPGLGSPFDLGSWAFEPIAFQKAVLWTMAFEGLGLGCGSGPLTARYFPPIGGALYFLHPGTTKLPLFPGIPVLGGSRRTWLDVALYAAHYVFLVRALTAPALDLGMLLPPIILLPIMALSDKTLFLASRGEHYHPALICFLFTASWLPAVKVVWLAIWLGAATSKLNRHFPSVVCVMTSNSPMTRALPWLRRRMYAAYPDDLRPSALARRMAHSGTVVEYCFPLVLAFSSGGPVTTVALVVMLGFHIFITSNIPMGVPIEWNVIMVYGAFFLFGHHAGVGFWEIGSPLLAGYLALALVALPIYGNLVPARVSFLCALRYYAGNWAYSIWLFRGDSSKKLDTHLVKAAPRVPDQLRRMYDEVTIAGLLSRVVAWRAMHLHGRALRFLLPKAVDDLEAYEYVDGELVAGIVLGWNFGDGHLHGRQLLQAVQQQCGFEAGELRHVFVESQPMGQPHMAWTISDAATGVLEQGLIAVDDLIDLQPWPEDQSG